MLFKKKTTLIDAVMMECPVCGAVHEVAKFKKVVKTKVNDIKVTHNKIYYVCPTYNKQFVTDRISDENRQSAITAYESMCVPC